MHNVVHFINILQQWVRSAAGNTLLVGSKDPFKMPWETWHTYPPSHVCNTTSIYWIIAGDDVEDASNIGYADKSPNEDIMERAYWYGVYNVKEGHHNVRLKCRKRYSRSLNFTICWKEPPLEKASYAYGFRCTNLKLPQIQTLMTQCTCIFKYGWEFPPQQLFWYKAKFLILLCWQIIIINALPHTQPQSSQLVQ